MKRVVSGNRLLLKGICLGLALTLGASLMAAGAMAALQRFQQQEREMNQEKVGKVFNCIFDRKEGKFFIGRTEFDSPDVDNNVIVDGSKHYVQIGHFVQIRITEATDFDLYGEPV